MRTKYSVALMIMAGLMLQTMPSGLLAQNAVGDRGNPRHGGTRSVVRSLNGMIATSQPLASSAGLRILQQGGNAIDAAVAAAAVLCVVEPMMVSPGGDLFAMVWDARNRRLRALNASGRSPAGQTIEAMRGKGITGKPTVGIHTVTVPGAVDGWDTLLKAYGTMTLAQVLQPAIEYAEKGFPVTEIIGTDWSSGLKYRDEAVFASTFLPNGRPPQIGEVFRNPNLASSFRKIAKGGRDEMYSGELAAKIVRFAQAHGGFHTMKDFANHRSTWVDPISTTYHGYSVYELPPNNQGLAALEMLNILEGFDLKSLGHNTGEYLHLLVEAKKLAFIDRALHIADPAFYQAPISRLLSKEYGAALRAKINPTEVSSISTDGPTGGEDTVYLTVVDKDRNCVSFIQSLFSEFGSGLVAGDTGILLHNRGAGFSYDESSPNRLEGGKRPFHTLIPAMVFRDGKPWVTFGVMGGDMQAQGHVQVLLNLIDFGMDIQEAGEQPRFRHFENGLALESAISQAARATLTSKGHRLTTAPGSFGGYQAIMIDPLTGALAAGSDPRKDGCAIGY